MHTFFFLQMKYVASISSFTKSWKDANHFPLTSQMEVKYFNLFKFS